MNYMWLQSQSSRMQALKSGRSLTRTVQLWTSLNFFNLPSLKAYKNISHIDLLWLNVINTWKCSVQTIKCCINMFIMMMGKHLETILHFIDHPKAQKCKVNCPMSQLFRTKPWWDNRTLATKLGHLLLPPQTTWPLVLHFLYILLLSHWLLL